MNELWRFSQQDAFDSFYMVINKIPAFGNIKGLQITIYIIKNVCVRKYLRTSHQATILAVFWCLNGFLSSVCNCCQLIQLILRPSNFRKRELGLKTRFISLREQLCDLLQRYENENWHKNDPGGGAFALYFRPQPPGI